MDIRVQQYVPDVGWVASEAQIAAPQMGDARATAMRAGGTVTLSANCQITAVFGVPRRGLARLMVCINSCEDFVYYAFLLDCMLYVPTQYPHAWFSHVPCKSMHCTTGDAIRLARLLCKLDVMYIVQSDSAVTLRTICSVPWYFQRTRTVSITNTLLRQNTQLQKNEWHGLAQRHGGRRLHT